MRKSIFLGMIACFLVFHTMVSAAQTSIVLMPQFGTQVVSVEPGDTLTYLDFKGYGKMTSTNANKSFATTIFRPAQEGYSIYIDFDTVHVVQIAGNAPTCLKIYNGVFDTLSVTYPTDYQGVTADVFPHTAAQLDSLTLSQTYGGIFRHKTYLSSDASGALSCCFSSCAKVNSFGWNAKVYALPNRPQKTTLAVPDYSQVATSISGGEKNVSLGAFALQTDGNAPVDTLLSVQFTLTDKTVFDPAKLVLYIGNAERTLLPTASNPYTGIRSKVETTYSEADGVYTLTMKQPLELADNLFCLGGDVLTNAPWDGLSTLTITGITTKQGTVAVADVTPVAQKVLPIVCLEGGLDKTVDVNRSDIRFYDNGGAENRYTNAAAAGTVQFRPTTEGSRVMLDFKSIAISSRDTLRVYSGSVINDADLLYIGKNGDKNIRIKSLSEDGVLTVRFTTKSTDNSVSSYNGWEATASEFVPAPMVIASSTVSKEKATPTCGTKGVQVLHFVLNAENTENALQPTAFAFNTGNTYAAIEHVKLYYTGSSSKFSTTLFVAESDITSNEFVLTANDMSAFNEGEQHFFVVADISADAATDDPIDLNIVSVTFADQSSYTGFENPTGSMKVLNAIASVCDENTYTIKGKWQFTHTAAKASDYPAVPGGYTMEGCEQVSIFVPATAGSKLQMSFSEFDIYYANDEWDTNMAQFVVYNGQGIEGDVLFEVNSLETATMLPATITSTAADGSLTVQFNANPTFMGYTNAAGWDATVSETNAVQPMVVSSSVVTKENVTPSAGDTGVRLMHFVLQTENADTPLQPTTFVFNTGSTYPTVSHAKLYYTGDSSKFVTTNLIAESDITSDVFVLTPETAPMLGEGENHFFVAIDIDSEARNDKSIDVNLTEVTFSNATSFSDFANPTSSAKVKNSIESKSDEHTYIIFDTWQFTSMYADPTVPDFGFDIWTPGDQVSIFVPATEGKKIQISFTEFEVMVYNDLEYDNEPSIFVVYDGQGTTGKKLFEVTSKETATTLPPTLTSSSADGALTVLFNPNNDNYTYMQGGKGWVSSVSEVGNGGTNMVPVVSNESITKYILPTGQMVIERDGVLYNVAGQRIK